MRILNFIYLFLVIVVICASCSNKQYQTLFEQRKLISDSLAKKNITPIGEYHIKPQDILQIRNLQNSKNILDVNPQVSASSAQASSNTQGETFQVESDSTVALTGLGHVKVVGLTRLEAQKMIEELYRKLALRNPIIELKIVNLKVTILGEIKVQGNYVLTKDKTTLVELIGEASGITERANERDIQIIRGTKKDPEVIDIDLRNIHSINSPEAILQSGDIVYVTKNKRAARSDNLQNFNTIFQPVLILFNTALILLTLIRH